MKRGFAVVKKYANANLSLPSRSTEHAAGYDFHSLFDFVLKPGEIRKIPTGIKASFNDEDKNVFVWTTASRTLQVGEQYTVKGTVKEHKMYKHTKQTILTRCRCQEVE